MSDEHHEPLDALTRTLIDHKVRQLRRRRGFRTTEADDLSQELALRLLRRLDRFDPARSRLSTFVRLALGSIASHLLREQRARQKVRFLSLEQLVRAGDGRVERGTLLSADAEDLRRRQETVCPRDRAELALDVASALAELPPWLRHLAEQLKTRSLSQLAQEQQIPRSTLQGYVRKLRQHFEQKNLGPNPGDASSNRPPRGDKER